MREKVFEENIIYKYAHKRWIMRALLNLIFLKDIYVLQRQITCIAPSAEIVIAHDTNVANIPEFARNIKSALGAHAQVLSIDPVSFRHVVRSLDFILFIFTRVFLYIISGKFGVCFKKFSFYNELRRSDHVIKEILSDKTVVVFYEKSVLSMYLKAYARRFVVMQHGIPTDTYFPSLADCYLTWNEYFKSFLSAHYDGEIIVVGYPDTLSPIMERQKRYDLLFLSQRGSSPDVIKKCEAVKAKINILGNLGCKILVKLHPAEKASDFKYHDLIDIYPGDSIEEAASLCGAACSYYSTALYLLGAVGFPVFRISASSGESVAGVLAQIPELDLVKVGSVKSTTLASDVKLFELNSIALKSALALSS